MRLCVVEQAQLESLAEQKLIENGMRNIRALLVPAQVEYDTTVLAIANPKTATVMRYQTTVERSLARILGRIDRLQAARGGKPLPTLPETKNPRVSTPRSFLPLWDSLGSGRRARPRVTNFNDVEIFRRGDGAKRSPPRWSATETVPTALGTEGALTGKATLVGGLSSYGAFCSGRRARTADLVINSHPLYQLSYAGMQRNF